MGKSTLRPLENNDTPLYGPKGILVCGLDTSQAERFKHLIKALAWSDVPLIFAGMEHLATPVADLFETQPATIEPMGGVAVIMGGITGGQLHQLMAVWNAVGLLPTLWATLQQESSTWPLATLLKHLAEEHRKAMEARKNEAAEAARPS